MNTQFRFRIAECALWKGLSKRTAVLWILLCANPVVWGQELQERWEDYTGIEAQLEAMVAQRASLELKEENLQQEITDLQGSRSWVNGWLVEMQLSRKTAEQTQLADSLQMLKEKASDLSQERKQALAALKEAYRQRVLAPETGERLTSAEKRDALVLGQRLMTEGRSSADLPDYSSILTSSYEDDTVRSLVLEDLRSVLGAKLTVIDSLLNERRSERELTHRLDAFHRDLSLQLESDRDLGTGGSQMSSADAEGGLLALDDALEAGYSSGNIDQKRAQSAGSVESPAAIEGEFDFGTTTTSISDDIARLETKRLQYEALLHRIEGELAR